MSEVAAPALPVWKCELGEMNDLTVGSKFTARCQGDIPVEWKEGPLTVAFADKEQAYTLFVLDAPKLEANTAELVLTAYKAGDHQPEYVRIVQGEHGFEWQKPAWKVQSVLKQGEKQEPYPPYGPWGLSIPVWVLVAAILTLVLAAVLIARFLRRRSQRNRMLADLEKHKTALSPVHQFYRDARNLRRRLHHLKTSEEVSEVAKDLNHEFRLYILREFQIPTLDWSNREIMADLKKRHPRVFKKAGNTLSKTLRELVGLREQKDILLKDVEQLYRMSLESVEKLDQSVMDSKGGKR